MTKFGKNDLFVFGKLVKIFQIICKDHKTFDVDTVVHDYTKYRFIQ